MKYLITIIGVVTIVIGLGFYLQSEQTPLADIPQSERCLSMCQRRDGGEIRGLKGKSREEIRSLLGDPQNIDADSDVWVWLFQWDGYKDRGFTRDWKTMAANSLGDGLWIRFHRDRCVVNFPYSFSALSPLDYLHIEPDIE